MAKMTVEDLLEDREAREIIVLPKIHAVITPAVLSHLILPGLLDTCVVYNVTFGIDICL